MGHVVMLLCTYRVTITDLQGTPHTVEVAASSVFEAVAFGLKAIEGDNWRTNGFIPVKVRVLDVPAEYEVKLRDFTKWLDRRGNSPRGVIDRKRIREILGLSKSAWL
jgi:hypothetical protein